MTLLMLELILKSKLIIQFMQIKFVNALLIRLLIQVSLYAELESE